MFQCQLGDAARFTVQIEGCPGHGLDAVDFRVKHGLPSEPRVTISLPSLSWDDEEFCRQHADLLNEEANLRWGNVRQTIYFVSPDGRGDAVTVAVQETLQQIRSYREQTEREEHTDVGVAWEVLTAIEQRLAALGLQG